MHFSAVWGVDITIVSLAKHNIAYLRPLFPPSPFNTPFLHLFLSSIQFQALINILKMGIPHSTARWVAPASFLIDFAAQQYGMLSSPNMKDVHDANLSFWSPQPFFIAGFFFPQQLFQLAWLYRLWKLDPKKSESERKEVEQMVEFVPYYVVGNLCIASKLPYLVLSLFICSCWFLWK